MPLFEFNALRRYLETMTSQRGTLNTMPSSEINDFPPPPTALLSSAVLRWWFFAFGWVMIGLGVIGVLVPGLPTTVFLIVAVWAFSKSSVRFQLWLWEHRVLGPSVRNWYQFRVIPIRAKVFAITMMVGSVVYMALINEGNLFPPFLLAGVLAPIGIYICTRAGAAPADWQAVSTPQKEG